tara:strand:- start:32349 stop:34205 length:1857 start_codon:yes stop_codon:yes gene_type:complete
MLKFKFFLKLYFFWLFLFFINRVIFFIFYFKSFKNIKILEILQIVPNSIELDISFISYVASIAFLLILLGFILSSFKIEPFINKTVNFFIVSMILFTNIVSAGEICLYKEWESKLNYTALTHFKHPREVFLTASNIDYLIFSFYILISIIVIRFYFNNIKIHFKFQKSSFKSILKRVFFAPLILGVFFYFIRGGMQSIPINISDSYFSKNIIVNDLTVNSNWNIIQSYFKSSRSINGNPYIKYSKKEYDLFVENYISDSNITVLPTKILKDNQPNIVFILLESWSADIIENLGGLKDITPNFKKLEEHGLLFTNFYSNGWKSEQAVSSIFSSFPVFPYISIIKETDKARKLPSINKSLKNYNSSFIFGGQLSYGNIKGFLLNQKFDLVLDIDDFNYPRGRLGIHDEFMFDEFHLHLNKMQKPFFSTLFTLSSHSPYDFPFKHKFSFNSRHDPYVNSVAYTDSCLGVFFQKIKNEKWYNNTLFIIVSDHSHSTPIYRRVAQKERFKIPMLWYGNVLHEKYKGLSNEILSSHIDITPTLLSQLNYKVDSKYFGNDIFKLNKKYVPYSFVRGYGMINGFSNYAYSITYDKPFEIDIKKDSNIIKNTELFMQYSFDKYMHIK